MLLGELGSDFVENSGLVGKRAWIFGLKAVGFQGCPSERLSRKISRTGLPFMRLVDSSTTP